MHLSNVLKRAWRHAFLASSMVLALPFAFIPAVTQAHIDPAGCSATGVNISLSVYRADGVTAITGANRVVDGETIKYQATLAFAGSPNCAFEGGTLNITTPDGVVHNVTPGGGVPEIGGAGVPSITSAFVPYVVNPADEGANGSIVASTNYSGGTAHDSDNNTPNSVSGSSGLTRIAIHANIQISPTGVNEINHPHTFTAHANFNTGSGFANAPDGTVINLSLSGVGGLSSPTCTTAGGTGSCTVTDTSLVPGVDTVTASTTLSFGGASVSVVTNGLAGNSPTAQKTWVDANIQITPALDTDPINDQHVLTGHVNVNSGTGGYLNAPDGTVINFTIDSGPGSFVGPNSCTTSGGTGSCPVTITSAVIGTTVISANTTVSVGGVTLTRDTNGSAGNSGPASKNWVAVSLTTTASGSVTVGGNIHDTAHLSGGNSPTGTISFDVFGPGDTTCATPLIPQPTSATVNGNGDYNSGNFLAMAAGTYRWIAHYSGDVNNNATSTSCNDPNESVVVNPAAPSIATTLSATSVNTGTAVHDSSALTGASPNAGGTVTYTVYTDNACSLGAQNAGTKNVTNGIVPDSDPITFNTAGTFYWQASYSGDVNNAAAISPCQSEILTVNQPAGQYCSPGYWKQSQHFDSWVSYNPDDKFSTVFGRTITVMWSSKGKPAPLTDPTLLQALQANGGGINLLARVAVDALLNSTSMSYGFTSAQVISMVQSAIDAGTGSAYQSVANQFTIPENCPLN